MLRVALRSLLARRARLLMSTFAIVLGVAFVVGTLIFTDTLDRSLTALLASSAGDVEVRPVGAEDRLAPQAGVSDRTVPGALVDRLARVPGVARADGMVSTTGVYVVDTSGKAVGGFGPPALGGNYSDAPSASGSGERLVAGHAPQGSDEVVLDTSTARRGGYAVGDRVPLILPSGRARLRPRLVGLVAIGDASADDSADDSASAGLNGATLVLFDTGTAQRLLLGGRAGFTSVRLTADDGVSEQQLAHAVGPDLPQGVEAVTGDQAIAETSDTLRDAISFLTTFLLIFGAIALVVGSFLIVNTFSMLIAQRSRELALLRALGASRRQVSRSVRIEALLLGLVGSTLGLGSGVLLAVGLRTLFARFGLDLSGRALVFAPRTPITAYVVGVVVTVAAAWLPARRTARIAPVQAMRDDVALPESSLRRRFVGGLLATAVGAGALALGLGAVGDVPGELWWVGVGALLVLLGVSVMTPVLARPYLAACAGLYRRLFGAVGVLAGQNARRNPRRSAATASALMIGLTLAATMSILGASAKASIDESIGQDFVGDFVVSNVYGATFNPAIARQMRRVPGVGLVVENRSQQVSTADGGRVRVGALDSSAAALLSLGGSGGSGGSGATGLSGGGFDLPAETVVLSADYARTSGLGAGDVVKVDVPAGTRSWRVAAVVPGNSVIGDAVITTEATLRSAGFRPRDSLLVIVADPGASANGVLDRLRGVVSDLPVVTVQDEGAYAAQQRAPVDRFVRVIYALLSLALLIAVLGVVNTLALSVVERTRELGLLRAVGMSRRQIRRMVRLESVVIAVLGAVLGVLLGVVFGVSLLRALRDQGLDVIAVPWTQLALFVVLGIVVGVLAAVVPARRAARLDVLTAIGVD